MVFVMLEDYGIWLCVYEMKYSVGKVVLGSVDKVILVF